jgi:hypothetical protein
MFNKKLEWYNIVCEARKAERENGEAASEKVRGKEKSKREIRR